MEEREDRVGEKEGGGGIGMRKREVKEKLVRGRN